MHQGNILLIEDDKACQELIRQSLSDYYFFCAQDLKEAKKILMDRLKQIDAILIDIHLPDGDGLRLLHELHEAKESSDVPCIILSADKDISGKVMAFSSGAEDFIAKPFDPIELKVRVDARIRKSRRSKESSPVHEVGDLLLDMHRQRAFHFSPYGTKSDLGLTAKEFQLLRLFCQRLETVFSRDHIMAVVWDGVSVSDRTIDSHVAHLRRKIEASQLQIETIKGVGYLAQIKVHRS